MSAVFGKPFNLSYTPYDRRGETVAPFELVSARIYYTQPTAEQIQDDDNQSPGDAIAENSSNWVDGEFIDEKLIPFGSLADPGPFDSSRYRKQCWVVVSFRYEDDGEIVRDVLPTFIMRTSGALSRFNVTFDDVAGLDSGLRDYGARIDVSKKILLAEKLVTVDLELEMMALERIEQGDAKELVLFRTAVLMFSDLQNEQGDSWREKKKDWETDYGKLLEKIKIAWDRDNNKVKDPEVAGETNSGAIWVMR